ncbi:ribonuclease H [Senna tora]|uniref:Ribonuclease H n=1 Tax=Senna tora TaxID=362788 RepID=A0A835C8F9_9FABA|nr:ribonuclease H [Senna tora]
MRHFMWRVCSEALPSRNALLKRRYVSSDLCPFCGSASETIEHMMLLCDWVKELWFISPLTLRISEFAVSRFDDWCCKMLTGHSELDDFNKVDDISRKGSVKCFWVVDGASEVVFASCALMAETKALIKAFSLCEKYGDTNIIFETDCAVFYDVVVTGSLVGRDWRCSEAMDMACLLKNSSTCSSFSLVCRQRNFAADWLAKNCVKGLVPLNWVTVIPIPFLVILKADFNIVFGSLNESTGVENMLEWIKVVKLVKEEKHIAGCVILLFQISELSTCMSTIVVLAFIFFNKYSSSVLIACVSLAPRLEVFLQHEG